MTYELQYGSVWKPLIRRTGTDHGTPVDYYETANGRHRLSIPVFEALKKSGRVRARIEPWLERGYYLESRGER